MKDPIKLKELVVKELDLAKIMLDYKVQFAFNPMRMDETQFKCPFHGNDNKPSARLYRKTQTCWCWVCQKKWDLISFISDMEHLNFVNSVNFLIKKYKVDTSSVSDNLELTLETAAEKPVSDLNVLLILLKRKIRSLRGKIEFEKYKMMCVALYMIFLEKSEEKALDKAKKFELKLEKI